MSIIYKLGLALVAVLLLVAGVYKGIDAIGDSRERVVVARYDSAIRAQKDEAARVLKVAEDRAAAAERQLTDFKVSQEKIDATNTKISTDLRTALRSAVAGSAGRLRDPNAAAQCGRSGGDSQNQGATSAGNSSEDPASSGGFLSAEITRLLLDEAQENDTINLAYISCRADAFKVREVLAQ